MMIFQNFLSLAAAISLLGLSSSIYAQDSAATTTEPWDITEKNQIDAAPKIIAKVNGLVCDFCAQALTKVFKKQEAVESLKVDLNAGEVRITLKDDQKLSDETVKDLIRKSGYSPVEIKRYGGA